MGGDGRVTGDEDERRRTERIEDDRHAPRHAPVPQRSQPPRRHLPRLMGLGDAVHEERHRGRLGRQVALIMAGDDLPPWTFRHATTIRARAASRTTPRTSGSLAVAVVENRPAAPHGSRTRSRRFIERTAAARIRDSWSSPSMRRDEVKRMPRAAGRQRGQTREREALRIDRQPAAADPGQVGGLACGARVELGGEGGEEWRAGAGQPGRRAAT